jgi:hypothetical protein
MLRSVSAVLFSSAHVFCEGILRVLQIWYRQDMLASASDKPRQHGVKGVYYAGHCLDIKDCHGTFDHVANCGTCEHETACPRSRSRNSAAKASRDDPNETATTAKTPEVYDICIIGAGCIGAAVARAPLASTAFRSCGWTPPTTSVTAPPRATRASFTPALMTNPDRCMRSTAGAGTRCLPRARCRPALRLPEDR